MLEDAIERSHQQRVSDEARLIRLRNETEIKRSQCKFQNARMIKGVVDVKNEIMTNQKRKMTEMEPLQKRRETARREIRLEKREDYFRSALEQDANEQIEKPRETLLNDLRIQLDNNNNNNEEGKDENDGMDKE